MICFVDVDIFYDWHFWLNYTYIDNTCKNLLVPFDLQTLTIALRILFVVMDDALMSQIHTHVCAMKATQD